MALVRLLHLRKYKGQYKPVSRQLRPRDTAVGTITTYHTSSAQNLSRKIYQGFLQQISLREVDRMSCTDPRSCLRKGLQHRAEGSIRPKKNLRSFPLDNCGQLIQHKIKNASSAKIPNNQTPTQQTTKTNHQIHEREETTPPPPLVTAVQT